MELSREAVLAALSKVTDTGAGLDLVSLNFVRNLTIKAGTVTFEMVINTPASPSKVLLQDAARLALTALPGVEHVEIQLLTDIPRPSGVEGKQSVPGVANIVAVSSGKGGVGKSTVAVNLAVALSGFGARVGLLDTDVYGPNVPIMMGLSQEPVVKAQRLQPLEAYGVKVMSLGFLNPGDRPVVWRGPMLHTAVRQFLYDVEWGELDYLVVDMPPGTGDAQLSLAQLVPVQGAVLVTTPQAVALADVRKAFRMFEQVKVPILGIVENMSYFICPNCSEKHEIFGARGGEELAQAFNSNLLGRIPFSINIREGGDSGVPITARAAKSPQALAFLQIADNVASQVGLLAMAGSRLPVMDMSDSRGDRFVV
jgi:ATP-binding protein involved in chromosome partitioning